MRRFLFVILIALMIFSFCKPVNADLNDGLVAFYPFNGNANDESGNGNHGDVYGATLCEDRFGNINSAYNFNGHDFIRISNNSIFDVQNITVTAWISLATQFSVTQRRIINRQPFTNSAWGLEVFGDNYYGEAKTQFVFHVGNGSNYIICHSITDLQTNLWYFVAATHDSNTNTMKVYVNGDLEGQCHSQGLISPIYGDIDIGKTSEQDNYYWDGEIDDIRVYNRALSESEIEVLYTKEAIPLKLTLESYFPAKFPNICKIIYIADPNNQDEISKKAAEFAISSDGWGLESLGIAEYTTDGPPDWSATYNAVRLFVDTNYDYLESLFGYIFNDESYSYAYATPYGIPSLDLLFHTDAWVERLDHEIGESPDNYGVISGLMNGMSWQCPITDWGRFFIDIPSVYFFDNDNDGYGDPNITIIDCSGSSNYVENNLDCNDNAPNIYYGANEICDGEDNDCDGLIDEDYVPTNTLCGTGACESTGQMLCIDGNQINTCKPGTGAADDVTCDGTDNDCDGTVDEDYVPTNTVCGTGACESTGQMVCIDGNQINTCEPDTGVADDTICDGIDNDCDGNTDEDYIPRPTACGLGICASTGEIICQGGQETVICVPGQPAVDGETCNGLDDDCDGVIPEDEADADNDGWMVCAGDCDDSSNLMYPDAPSTKHGIDNDCSGIVEADEQVTPSTISFSITPVFRQQINIFPMINFLSQYFNFYPSYLWLGPYLTYPYQPVFTPQQFFSNTGFVRFPGYSYY